MAVSAGAKLARRLDLKIDASQVGLGAAVSGTAQ